MTNILALEGVNAHRWSVMHVTAAKIPAFHATALRLCALYAKSRFEGVTDRLVDLKMSPVPWWFVAIVAEREYGGPPHWDYQLGQGDALNKRSRNVPAGRGPFLSHDGDITPGHDAWTRGAVDALVNCPPFAAKWTTWTIGGVLTLLEEYNGLGYAVRGVPSAYVWSGSDQYMAGKFVRDHVYDPKRVDVQEGCAPLLSVMIAVDPTIAKGILS